MAENVCGQGKRNSGKANQRREEFKVFNICLPVLLLSANINLESLAQTATICGAATEMYASGMESSAKMYSILSCLAKLENNKRMQLYS